MLIPNPFDSGASKGNEVEIQAGRRNHPKLGRFILILLVATAVVIQFWPEIENFLTGLGQLSEARTIVEDREIGPIGSDEVEQWMEGRTWQ